MCISPAVRPLDAMLNQHPIDRWELAPRCGRRSREGSSDRTLVRARAGSISCSGWGTVNALSQPAICYLRRVVLFWPHARRHRRHRRHSRLRSSARRMSGRAHAKSPDRKHAVHSKPATARAHETREAARNRTGTSNTVGPLVWLSQRGVRIRARRQEPRAHR